MTIILTMITRMAGRNRGNDIMVHFTDSLYEYMMAQKPDTGRDSGLPRYPPGHKCHGCPYGRERPCVGICMKDLYSTNENAGRDPDAVPEKDPLCRITEKCHERSITWERD